MKYQLTPLNEGQEMNCSTIVSVSHEEAMNKAVAIAATLSYLLPGCDFTCLVKRANGKGKCLRGWPNGRVINETTGKTITNILF